MLQGYRVYFIGHDGHIMSRSEFLSENDESAKELARQMVDGQAVELWDRDRMIATFEPNHD